MPPGTLNVDITVLPSDVLSLFDEPFYELVHKLAGPVEAKLLEVQGIRSAHSLIHTEDIFDILKYECKALDEIKRKACFLLNDNRYIVKPGCKSNMRYFTQLLNLKNQEHLKSNGLRMKPKNKSNDTNNAGSSISQSPAQVLPLSSPLSQSTTTQTTDKMNESKHHDFLSQSLDEWYYKNKLKLNLPNEKFIEGTDYKLALLLNQGSEEAVISCACGIRINLPKGRMNFSLGNYYKHIRQTKCIMMKNKRKSISRNTNDDNDDDEDDETSQEETLETDVVNTSTTTSSNITASNNQSCSTSKKCTKSPSHNDYSRKIRQRS